MKLRIMSMTLLGALLFLLALSSFSYSQANFAICHRIESPETPTGYNLLAVDDQGAFNGHLNHGDVLPDANGACPASGTDGGGNPDPAALPEPLTILLFGTGLASVGYVTRRWRKNGELESDERA